MVAVLCLSTDAQLVVGVSSSEERQPQNDWFLLVVYNGGHWQLFIGDLIPCYHQVKVG